jgi:hypothetical protein
VGRSWYVAYRKGHDIAMKIAHDQGAAIEAACRLLKKGVDVTEIGPMVQTGTPPIEAAALREIYEARESRTSAE